MDLIGNGPQGCGIVLGRGEYLVLVKDTIYQDMDSDGVRSVMNFRLDLLRCGPVQCLL